MENTLVNFAGYSCFIKLGYYDQGNRKLAINLVSAVSDISKDLFVGEQIAKATTNHNALTPAPEYVIIKNYSENEGIAQSLCDAGLLNFKSNSQLIDGLLVMEKTDLLIMMENTYRKSINIAPLQLNFTAKKIKFS